MFKRSLILGAALAVLAPLTAYAADMAVKARSNVIGSYDAPASGCVPQNCSGWYAGFGILGDGSNQDVSGGGIDGRVFSTGGALKLQAGYQLWNGQWFAAVEAGIGYEYTTNTSGGAIVGGGGGSRLIGTELVKLGYNFFPSTQVATPMAGQSPVPLTVPANLLASSTPYLTMGGMQRRGANEWVTGVGVQTIIASGWATDVKYLHAPPQDGRPATSVVMFELNKHF
jgi:hypothetical protein